MQCVNINTYNGARWREQAAMSGSETRMITWVSSDSIMLFSQFLYQLGILLYALIYRATLMNLSENIERLKTVHLEGPLQETLKCFLYFSDYVSTSTTGQRVKV
jgi:hypothetical protein